MTMNKMIERVAREICLALYDKETTFPIEAARRAAKAAIAAMREPTADMIEAIPAGAHSRMHETVRENWRAMIDAALE
jgi:uncharacterized protein (DUF2141 family)